MTVREDKQDLPDSTAEAKATISLTPGVQRRIDAAERVVAEDRVFPAYPIVQRMGAGVAPVTVEIMHCQRRPGAAELEQFVGGGDRDFGRQHLGLRSPRRSWSGLRRRGECGQPRFLKRQLSLPVSTISQW